MLIPLVVAALLTADPLERPKLLVQDIAAGQGVDLEVARSISTHVAAELTRRGAHDVLTSQNLNTLFGMERQRQLSGCTEESSSCIAELAGALGARFILSGNLVRLGASWQLTLQTVDATSGRAIGRATRLAKDPSELLDGWSTTIAEAAGLPPPVQPSRVPPALVLGAGAAIAIGGAVVLFQTSFRETELTTELSLADSNPAVLRPAKAYEADVAALRTQRTFSFVALGVGSAAMIGGLIWLLRTQDTGPTLTALVAPNGFHVSLTWTLR